MCISLASARASPVCAAVLIWTGISHQPEAAISCLHYGDFGGFFPVMDPDT